MNTLELSKLKQYLLQEIGDASKEPYYSEIIVDSEEERIYEFTTTSGLLYQVTIETLFESPMKPTVAIVKFGIIQRNDPDKVDYNAQTGDSDIYKVMATVVDIVRKDLKENPADIIEFKPTKRPNKDINAVDNVRTQLYLRYIRAEFPNAEVTQTEHGDIRVTLS